MISEKITLSYLEWSDILFNEGNDIFNILDENECEQNGKYQHCEIVIKRKSDGKKFLGYVIRSGSYHTGWDYIEDSIDFKECVEKEIIKKVCEKVWVFV